MTGNQNVKLDKSQFIFNYFKYAPITSVDIELNFCYINIF